jgi:hypothetical protein
MIFRFRGMAFVIVSLIGLYYIVYEFEFGDFLRHILISRCGKIR